MDGFGPGKGSSEIQSFDLPDGIGQFILGHCLLDHSKSFSYPKEVAKHRWHFIPGDLNKCSFIVLKAGFRLL